MAGNYVLVQAASSAAIYEVIRAEQVGIGKLERGLVVKYINERTFYQWGLVIGISDDFALLDYHKFQLDLFWKPMDLSVPKNKGNAAEDEDDEIIDVVALDFSCASNERAAQTITVAAEVHPYPRVHYPDVERDMRMQPVAVASSSSSRREPDLEEISVVVEENAMEVCYPRTRSSSNESGLGTDEVASNSSNHGESDAEQVRIAAENAVQVVDAKPQAIVVVDALEAEEPKEKSNGTDDEDAEEDGPILEDVDEKVGTVWFGKNETAIPLATYKSISWKCYKLATRALLMALFTRHTLATHSMTGKKSPAFLQTGKEAKPQLDAKKVDDIVYIVRRKCKHTTVRLVRASVTSKCADENKMLRKRNEKLKKAGLPVIEKCC